MPGIDASSNEQGIGRQKRPGLAGPTPTRADLRHRGRRRAVFAVVGTIVGSVLGVAGWAIIDRADTRAGVIAIVALAGAGMLGGTVIASLVVVAVEDGENEQLAQNAGHTADQRTARDETDVINGTSGGDPRVAVRTHDPSADEPPG